MNPCRPTTPPPIRAPIRAPRHRTVRRPRRGGAILVLALFGVGLLLSVALTAATTVRLRWVRADDLLRRHQARDNARSALAEALHRLAATPPAEVHHLGEPWADPNATGGVQLTDESARLHLLRCSVGELRALLILAADLPPQRAAALAEAILAWRTGRPQPPVALEALREVPGMDAVILAHIASHLTLHGSGRINLNTVDEVVFTTLLRAQNLPYDVERSLWQGLRTARHAGRVLEHLEPRAVTDHLLGPRVIPSPALVRALAALVPRVGLRSEYVAATAVGRPSTGERPTVTLEAVLRHDDLQIVRWTES